MKHKFAIICLVIASFAAGCSSIPLPSFPWSSPPVQINPSAEALFNEGMEFFNNKKYARAIDRLQRVKAEFPFSPQLTQAELKLAEAYYLNKQYPEAISAFKEFQTIHPTNENIPFVIYHLGLAHFDQFTSIDRDQKMTEIAKGYFETVVRNHPNSPYAEKAKEKLAKSEQYLAEHEFNIARFYFNEKNYPAARDRFEEILRRFPNNPAAPQALYYLGESYRLDKNGVKAALAYEALIQHYSGSPLAKEAEAQLAQLEKVKQDPLALLLKSDRRPLFVPTPTPDKSPSKELNLVAKKEVVQEEPIVEKGLFRRVTDTINPLNWFSSSDDGEKNKSKQDGKITAAKAKQEKPKVEPPTDPGLLTKVDESLNRRGIDTGTKTLPTPKPSATELSKASEEPAPPPSDTKAILTEIDTKLKKEGKSLDNLPPPPEAAPIFQAAGMEQKKVGASESAAPPSASTSGLIAGIDEALKRKGIKTPKAGDLTKLPKGMNESEASSVPAPRPASQTKVELAPRLPQEKGPLFLESGEFQVKTTPEETKEASEQKAPEESQQPKALPGSVVKSPSQTQTAKPAEKKITPEGEEQKSALDQLKEDLQSVGRILNPFNW